MDEKKPEKNYSGYRIFVDEPELGKTVLDFPKYIETLSNIIESTKPRYTIGIFGKWGTGKTTLMDNIQKRLDKQYNCLYFNAWRFEGEKRNATYPLMLSILEKLFNTPAVRAGFDDIKKGEKESFGKKFFRVLNAINVSGSVGIPGGSLDISLDRGKLEKKYEGLSVEDINNFFKEIKSPLVEGIKILRDDLIPMIKDVKGKNKELKLIVFIDDLDRCTPEKAAQVLESIKVFFDTKGIVFVLGLSKEIVEAAIDIKYDKFEKLGIFSGSDYIKKIIQVPFVLPTWTRKDIKKYLETMIGNHEDTTFKEFFNKNSEIIADAVEKNPREVKRLLNNFILSRKIFDEDVKIEYPKKYSNESKNPFNLKLLLIQSLSSRWRWFYDDIFRSVKIVPDIREELAHYSELDGKRLSIEEEPGPESPEPESPEPESPEPESPEPETSEPEKSIFFMEEKEEDPVLIRFLKKHCNPILEMSEDEWEKFRRTTTEISPESIEKQKKTENRQKIIKIERSLKVSQKELLGDAEIYAKYSFDGPKFWDNKQKWKNNQGDKRQKIRKQLEQIKFKLQNLRRVDKDRAYELTSQFQKILKINSELSNMGYQILDESYDPRTEYDSKEEISEKDGKMKQQPQ